MLNIDKLGTTVFIGTINEFSLEFKKKKKAQFFFFSRVLQHTIQPPNIALYN